MADFCLKGIFDVLVFIRSDKKSLKSHAQKHFSMISRQSSLKIMLHDNRVVFALYLRLH